MATPAQMKERLMALRGDMIAIAGECMLEEKDKIVGLLVQQQYEEGVDSKGQQLRPYSRNYAKEKYELTGRGDKTDLELTGEFHAAMDLRVDGDEYEIESNATTADGVLKSAWLNKWNEQKGGADVMTLTAENKSVAWSIIKDRFMERCNEELALD